MYQGLYKSTRAYCHILICITMCSHILPCITMHCHVEPCIASISIYHVLPCIAMYSHVFPCIAMYCHVLPCIAMYSHVLPCTAMYCHVLSRPPEPPSLSCLRHSSLALSCQYYTYSQLSPTKEKFSALPLLFQLLFHPPRKER